MPKITVKDAYKNLDEWQSYAHSWIEEAKKCYDAVDGEQWDEIDKADLEVADRPAVTFNRLSAFVRGVSGLEGVNRQEAAYYPVSGDPDAAGTELLNLAAKWVRRRSAAQEQESEAMRDMFICGMGWTDTSVHFDDRGRKQIHIRRMDPLTMAWDPGSRTKGLDDAWWMMTWTLMHRDEVLERWENAEEFLSETGSPTIPPGMVPRKVVTAKDDYLNKTLWSQPVADENYVTVIQYQYKTYSKPARGSRRLEKLIQEIDTRVEEQRHEHPIVPLFPHRPIEYRQKFMVGHNELSDDLLAEGEFTFKALTGTLRRKGGTWYGFVKDLISPQEWSNKSYSLMIDIVSSQAKGGLFAETDAFQDIRQAERDYANPRKILFLNPGGIDRIRDRTVQAFPPAITQILDLANNAIPLVAGVSVEFLGQADQVQPGVLEYQRRQSTITLLSGYFNMISLYRERQGRLLGKMILRYMNDGRLLRLVGEGRAKDVPLLFQPDFLEFDVEVDEAPTSPDVKERTWMVLREIVPLLAQFGIPVPPEIVEYAPIPKSLQEKFKESLTPREPQPDPNAELMRIAAEGEIKKAELENQRRLMELEIKKLEMQMKMTQAQSENMKTQIEVRRLQQESSNDLLMSDREMMLKELDIRLKEIELQIKFAENPGFQDRILSLRDTRAEAIVRDRVTEMIEAAKATAERVMAEVSAAAKQKPKGRRIKLRKKGLRITGAEILEDMDDGSSRKYDVDIQ
ncbi:MAG: hypothetical protein ACRD98_01855 [Nitrososphaera sp.]